MQDVADRVRINAADETAHLLDDALAYLQDGLQPLGRASLTFTAHLPEALTAELVELATIADGLVVRLQAAEQELQALAAGGEQA